MDARRVLFVFLLIFNLTSVWLAAGEDKINSSLFGIMASERT